MRAGLALVAAVAAVVAIAVVLAGVEHDGATAPTPKPTTTPSAAIRAGAPGTAPAVTADQVVRQGHLYDFAQADDGRLLTVWQRCDADYLHCRYAWQFGGGAPVLIAGGSGPSVRAVGNRFVLTPTGPRQGGTVVERDGSVRPVADGAPGGLGASVVVGWKGRTLSLVDAERAVRWPLAKLTGVEAWDQAAVSGSGIWAFGVTAATDARKVTDVGLWHSTDGTTWTRRSLTVGRPTMPGYVVASGDHVAALATYDGATVAPVGDLAVTADGGRSWRDLGRADVPFEYVDSMAASSTGTLFVVGGDLDGGKARLYRSTDGSWTRFTTVGTQVGEVRRGAEGVVGQAGSYDEPRLVGIADDGAVRILE